MSTWVRRAAGAAALATAAAGLAACGSDDTGTDDGGDTGAEASAFVEQEGSDVRDAAAAAMGELQSLRVSGELSVDGEQISIDLASSSGGDCTGTIGLDGLDADVLSADGQTWFRPSEEFWRAQGGAQADQIIEIVDGRWVVLGEDDGFAELCDLDELLDELLDEADEGTTYETGEVSDVNGTSAVAVVSTDEDGETSTGYIGVDEPHLLLRIEKTDSEEAGTVDFSDFDEPVDVEAPAEDDTVDLDTL